MHVIFDLIVFFLNSFEVYIIVNHDLYPLDYATFAFGFFKIFINGIEKDFRISVCQKMINVR